MLVRHQRIEQQQREHAGKETDRGGQPSRTTLLDRHVDRGYEQRPHRRGHHHARRESQQQLAYARRHVAAQQEDHCRPERSARKGYQKSVCHSAVYHAIQYIG